MRSCTLPKFPGDICGRLRWLSRLEHWSYEPRVAGSSPARSTIIFRNNRSSKDRAFFFVHHKCTIRGMHGHALFSACLVGVGAGDAALRTILVGSWSVRKHTTRWFLLHAGVNAVIATLSWPSVWATIVDPINLLNAEAYPPCLMGPGSKVPLHLINALHVYHAVAWQLSAQEWWHHILFATTLGGTGAWYDWGLLSNYLAFFLCGVPGGIEYALLVAQRMGACSDGCVRRASMRLNLYMRQPAVLLGLGVGYPALRAGKFQVPPWAILLHYALGTVNVCYYAAASVARAYRLEYKEDAKAG